MNEGIHDSYYHPKELAYRSKRTVWEIYDMLKIFRGLCLESALGRRFHSSRTLCENPELPTDLPQGLPPFA